MLFGSGILEVAISIVFVYLLLGLVCSVLNESIARMLALRANTLEEGIRNLLNDPNGQGLAEQFYNHPLIKGLAQQGWFDQKVGRKGRPSYIPARTFALALMDIFAPADTGAGSKNLNDIRDMVAKFQDTELRTALLILIDEAEGNLGQARQNLETWFNDAMDRVSGWYKRKVQLIILILSLIVTVALNADTLLISDAFLHDAALRASVVAAAEGIAREETLPEGMNRIQNELGSLGLPLGWVGACNNENPGEMPEFCEWKGWPYKILGLMLTIAALSLGAPFWFDLLNRFISFRSAGKVPEKTENTDSGN
jgi:hypothetical protein